MWPGRGSRLFTTEIIIAAFATLIATCKCPTTGKHTLIGTTSCIPLPSIWTQITLGTIASFMLGLFATNVLNRWWATRTHVNSVGGGCKNLTMLISAWTAHAGGSSADQCTRIVRLLNFAHVLLFQTVRGRTSLDLQALVKDGFCTEEEAEAVAGRPEPFVAVLGWVACIAQARAYAAFASAKSTGTVSVLLGAGSRKVYGEQQFHSAALIQTLFCSFR
jgi:hypothetical protein